MVDTIIKLAKTLDLLTTAEGVENEETARTLTEMGVSHLQGYHYARPMPLDDFKQWLSNS